MARTTSFTVLDEATRQLLRTVPVVMLTVSAEAVTERIAGTDRPLLHGEEDPLQRWMRIFSERRALYEEVADARFDTSRVPMSRVADQGMEWMRG